MFVFPTSAANAEVITALVVRITFDAASSRSFRPTDRQARSARNPGRGQDPDWSTSVSFARSARAAVGPAHDRTVRR